MRLLARCVTTNVRLVLADITYIKLREVEGNVTASLDNSARKGQYDQELR